jgi:hypothetical protein
VLFVNTGIFIFFVFLVILQISSSQSPLDELHRRVFALFPSDSALASAPHPAVSSSSPASTSASASTSTSVHFIQSLTLDSPNKFVQGGQGTQGQQGSLCAPNAFSFGQGASSPSLTSIGEHEDEDEDQTDSQEPPEASDQDEDWELLPTSSQSHPCMSRILAEPISVHHHCQSFVSVWF